jgi:methylthioribose-1-phosphate isomerase
LKVGERHYHTIWLNDDGHAVDIIDQRWLPHEFRIATLKTVEDVATAIRDMWVRGAPLIGVTAAYGVAIAMRADASNAALDAVWERLHETRPTAINLKCVWYFVCSLPIRESKQLMPALPRLLPRMCS